MNDVKKEPREITGKMVFWGFFGAFAIIFSVNMLLLFKAVSTFPGLEVKNSYVASQYFDEMANAQRALGWTPGVRYEDGLIHIIIRSENGALVFPETIQARIGRPTHGEEDQMANFVQKFNGYWFETELNSGKWFVYLDATSATGEPFTTRLEFFVTDDG